MYDLHDTTYLLAARTQFVEVFYPTFKRHLCSKDLAIECSLIDIRCNISDWGLIFFCDESLAIFFHLPCKLLQRSNEWFLDLDWSLRSWLLLWTWAFPHNIQILLILLRFIIFLLPIFQKPFGCFRAWRWSALFRAYLVLNNFNWILTCLFLKADWTHFNSVLTLDCAWPRMRLVVLVTWRDKLWVADFLFKDLALLDTLTHIRFNNIRHHHCILTICNSRLFKQQLLQLLFGKHVLLLLVI
jgi:hypothetical protein